MKKNEFALEAFKNIQELIKFIDQKSGAILVISGLILSSYLSNIKNITFSDFNSIKLIGVIVFLSSLSTLINILYVFYVSIFNILKPRLAKSYNENEMSLFYYEHLANLEKEQILEKYNSIDENKMLEYIVGQQYEVSQILIKKTNELNKSFNYLFASIVSLIVFLISIPLL